MNRRQRRVISKISSFLVLVFILSFGSYQLKQFSVSYRNDKQAEKVAAIQEEQRVLEEIKMQPVVQATSNRMSAVLGQTTGDGVCGQAWEWKCDDSKQVGAYMNKKDFLKAGETLELTEAMMIKNPEGLSMTGGVNLSVEVDLDGDGRTTSDERFGLCLDNGTKYETMSAISMSQPVLPKVVMGNELSMRSYDEEAEKFVKINMALLENLKPESYPRLCNPNDRVLDYLQRSMDIYNISPQTREKAQNFITGILAQCNAQAPGTPEEDFSKDWVEEDENLEIVTFLLGIENNERHNEVDEKFQGILSKKSLGLISPGDSYLYTYAFQPKSDTHKNVKMFGESIGTRSVADMLTEPQYTSAELTKNPDRIHTTEPNADSSTVLTTEGMGVHWETLRATFESAILGGVYYLPADGIEKTATPNALSYDPFTFSAGKYSCDPKKGNCPLVRAISGCKGTFSAGVDIRLRQIILSANDTTRYSNIVNEAPRTYVLGGNFISGNYIAPQGHVKNASFAELVYHSGRASGPTCQALLKDKISKQSKRIEDNELAFKAFLAELNAPKQSQAILISPVHVVAVTQALYDVDTAVVRWINGILRSLGLKGIPVPKIVQEVTSKDYKPALISFKRDSYLQGTQGLAPNENDALKAAEQEQKYLADMYNIQDYGDRWGIDCGLIEDDASGEVTEQYWLCLKDEKDVLPKCSTE